MKFTGKNSAPVTSDFLRNALERCRQGVAESRTGKTSHSPLDLLRTSRMRRRSVILCFCWQAFSIPKYKTKQPFLHQFPARFLQRVCYKPEIHNFSAVLFVCSGSSASFTPTIFVLGPQPFPVVQTVECSTNSESGGKKNKDADRVREREPTPPPPFAAFPVHISLCRPHCVNTQNRPVAYAYSRRVCLKIGTLRSNDATATRTSLKSKYYLRSFSLYRNYSYPLTLSNVGEPFWR